MSELLWYVCKCGRYTKNKQEINGECEDCEAKGTFRAVGKQLMAKILFQEILKLGEWYGDTALNDIFDCEEFSWSDWKERAKDIL